MVESVAAIKAILEYQDRHGFSLVNPRGVPIFGPTWSMTELQRWARANRVDYRLDNGLELEREEAAQPVKG